MAAGSHACAACKYQRRKCLPNCPLAPYFPPSNHSDFLNAHKLFGVRNIVRILANVDDARCKHIAMKSIIIQSNIRAKDPVGGCYRIICELQRQIDLLQAEFDLVLHQLSLFRAMELHNQQSQQHDCNLPLTDECDDIKPLLDIFYGKNSISFDCKQQFVQCSDKVITKQVADESVQQQEVDDIKSL